MYFARTCVAVFAASILASRAASAGEDPRKGQAEASFQEAIRLHDDGLHEEALTYFERAYSIYPSPNTRINIAREEQLLGRYLDALRHYREALRTSLLHPDAVPSVKRRIHEIEQQLGRVVVSGPKGLVVKFGDREHVLPLSEALEVEPGVVTLEGAYGATRYHGTSEARPGETVTVEMVAEGPPAASLPEPTHRVRDLVTGSVLGLGIVGLATGTVLALKAEGQIGDARRMGSTNPCAQRALSSCQRYDAMLHEIETTRDAARVSFAIGGGLVAISAAGFVLWPNAKIRPILMGRAIGLGGEF